MRRKPECYRIRVRDGLKDYYDDTEEGEYASRLRPGERFDESVVEILSKYDCTKCSCKLVCLLLPRQKVDVRYSPVTQLVEYEKAEQQNSRQYS